jgi:hypothetical protein
MSALAVLLYRKVLQAARRCDANTLGTKALLTTPPSSVFDRRRGRVLELEQAEQAEQTEQADGEVKVRLSGFAYDRLMQKYVTRSRAEFYLPRASAASAASAEAPHETFQAAIRQVRMDAMAARAAAATAAEAEDVAALDTFFATFFADLGFEAMRELTALAAAGDELLLLPSSLPALPSLPFALDISPDAGRPRYDRASSFEDWADMVLMTHPTACLGQPTLHGAVIVMTPRHHMDEADELGNDDKDSLIGVIVNKPLVLLPKWRRHGAAKETQGTPRSANEMVVVEDDDDDDDEEEEEKTGFACVLGDLLPGDSKQRLKRYGLGRNSGQQNKLEHEAVVTRVLDLPVFNGGDVGGYFSSRQTILSVLHEVADESSESSTAAGVSIALTKINSVDELVQLAKDGEVDLNKCKFFIGLACWDRDQLGSELERNVWIRARPSADLATNATPVPSNSDSDEDTEFEARNANLTQLALCGGNESLCSLARGTARIDAMRAPHDFSEMFWRASVASLGGEYAKIGTCVEADHDVCDRVLSDARQQSCERLMERMQKVAHNTSSSTSEEK